MYYLNKLRDPYGFDGESKPSQEHKSNDPIKNTVLFAVTI